MNGNSGVLPTLLVIDDDSDFLAMVVQSLKAWYELVTAKTLADGIEKVQTARPDAVLLDLTLPDSEAEKTVRTFKRLCPRECLLVVSGDGNPDVKKREIANNAWGYIVKDGMLRNPARTKAEIDSAIFYHEMAQNMDPTYHR